MITFLLTKEIQIKEFPNIIKKRFKNSKFNIVEYLNVGYAAKSFIVYSK